MVGASFRFLNPNEPFCMTYGGGIPDIDIGSLIAFPRAHGCATTLTGVVLPGRCGAIDLEDTTVRRFIENPPGDNSLINSGNLVMQPTVLARITGDDTSWETGPLPSLAHDDELRALKRLGFWQPMDTLRDKMALEDRWRDGRTPWKVWT